MFGVAIAAAIFATAGGYATPATYTAGLHPALLALAALAALGALAGLTVIRTVRTTPAVAE